MISSSLTRALLYTPAKLYELGVRTRIALYEKNLLTTYRLNAPVISIGNLTVGGTGKTPCVAFLACFLRDAGHSVAILSRGYKRESSGRVEVTNGKDILRGPREAGDEPYLLGKSCPGVRVVVDQDRYAAGKWLEERTPVSVFLLDDGFQHLRLSRNLNLLLIDATERLEEAEMLPLGRWREPISGLCRAGAVIITRSDQSLNRNELESLISKHSRSGTPVFYAHHEMTKLRRLNNGGTASPTEFIQKPIAAVSGIARPERFISDLLCRGMRVVVRRDFADHHRYSREEFLDIVESALIHGAQSIIITEKDAANLPEEYVKLSSLPVYAAQIEFRCENEEALKKLVLRTLR